MSRKSSPEFKMLYFQSEGPYQAENSRAGGNFSPRSRVSLCFTIPQRDKELLVLKFEYKVFNLPHKTAIAVSLRSYLSWP